MDDLFGDLDVEEVTPPPKRTKRRQVIVQRPENVQALGFGFTTPPGFQIAYTDGACFKDRGAAAWAWYRDEHGWATGGLASGTNNEVELLAIITLLEMAPLDIDLLVVSDSSYASNAISTWVDKWLVMDWVKSDKQPVENRPLIERGLAARNARTGQTYFGLVRGHGKGKDDAAVHVAGNDKADRLCFAAKHFIRDGEAYDQGPGWAPVVQSQATLEVLAAFQR